MVRQTTPEDILILRAIHREHFSHEFSFPDFATAYINVFTVTDDSGTIITVGGIRPIMEAVQVTNKSLSARVRREGLLEFMQACIFATANHHHTQLHAFVQNDEWYNQLQKYGFRPTAGKPLVIDV